MEKSENVEFFSGSFEAFDLNVGSYIQHVEPMKCCEY